MSLKDLRDKVLARVDWNASPTPSAVAVVDGFVNDAISDVVLDAPFLFYEADFKIRTQPDVGPSLTNDGLTINATDSTPAGTKNPWVLSSTLLVGSTSGQVSWPTDRSWDGRMISIKDAAGVWRTLRIRSIWADLATQTEYRISISLETPWDYSEWGSGPFYEWRVFTPEYYLPDDVIEVRSLRMEGVQAGGSIQFIDQPDAEAYGLLEHHESNGAVGSPAVAYRRRHEQLRGPRVSPVAQYVDLDEGIPRWLGPDPFGSFRYVVTYCWGKRDSEWANQGLAWWQGDSTRWEDRAAMGTDREDQHRDRFREPLWESSPSPASDIATVAAPDNDTPTGPIRVLLPNIEYMLGFMMDGVSDTNVFGRLSARHSGIFVRIYRQRIAEDFTHYTDLGTTVQGQSITSLRRLDFDDDFYLLAEMKIDSDNGGVYYDTGEALPDISRPLRQVNGYQSVRFHPAPTSEIKMVGRAVRRPPKLVSPYDVPRIHPDGYAVIVDRALMYLYERLASPMESAKAESRYMDGLRRLRVRYGVGRPSSQSVRKRAVRFPLSRTNNRWRR